MMHLIIFVFYFLLLCFAVTRINFFTQSIRPGYLVLLFAVHVAAGGIHTWIAFHYYPNHGDVWAFFGEGVVMKQQLLAHPLQFFASIFSDGGGLNIRDTRQPVLDVQYKILQYINAFLNLLSFDNLYINTLLFSFPVFAGTIALFRFFYAVFKKSLPAFCTLLLPSLLFWSSVVYKDSLFITAAGFFLLYLLQSRPIFRKGILLLTCIVLMIASRANALLILLPAIFFFLLTEKKNIGKGWALGITIGISITTAIAFDIFLPGGILTRICDRQKDFQLLTGGSRIYLPVLTPTASSFLSALPVAVANGFFQPYPGTGGKLIYTAFSIELLLTWAIVLYACWLIIRKKILSLSNVDIACLLFAVPGMIIIGYMIPFAGAIVRYRSIYLPFLLAPFINIICSYPSEHVQRIDKWICSDVLAPEQKRPGKHRLR